MTERRVTGVGREFGTSIPTTDSPGTTGSNRMFGDANASARSFSRFRIMSTRTRLPDAGSTLPPFHPGLSPYIVTVGPVNTWSTVTSIPYSARLFSISALRSSISDRVTPPDGALFNMSSRGSGQLNCEAAWLSTAVDTIAGNGRGPAESELPGSSLSTSSVSIGSVDRSSSSSPRSFQGGVPVISAEVAEAAPAVRPWIVGETATISVPVLLSGTADGLSACAVSAASAAASSNSSCAARSTRSARRRSIRSLHLRLALAAARPVSTVPRQE